MFGDLEPGIQKRITRRKSNKIIEDMFEFQMAARRFKKQKPYDQDDEDKDSITKQEVERLY